MEHTPGGSLVELDVFVKTAGANSVEESQRSNGVHVRRILGEIEGHFHVTLCAQIINFTAQE